MSDAQDGSGLAVIAQLFSAEGTPTGNEFVVSTTGAGNQFDPSIAALDGGGFVIAYEGPDTSSNGVYVQAFDANAAPIGPAQLTSDIQTSSQIDPDVTGLPGGGYVVTWHDDYNGSNFYVEDIRARIYDGTGAPTGGVFTVNTTGGDSSSQQTAPTTSTIAASADPNGLAAGGFVIAWENSGDIHAQVYDAFGTSVGAEFVANTTVASTQSEPVVAGLNGGRFVVVWTDQGGADGSAQGVFAQVFEGNGTAVGAEQQVNVEFSSTQHQPAVTATADGGFAVSWSAFTSGGSGDGSSYGIATRSFDAGGVPTTGEQIVNQEISGNQTLSDLIGLSTGNIFAVWQSDTSGTAGDGSGAGIFGRLLGDPSTFSKTSANPELSALSATHSFDENTVNAAPQRIDADGAVALSDSDSADFDGGRLQLSVIGRSEFEDNYLPQDANAQDQLGLDTSGAVAVSGSDVSVNGTNIGTIASDGTGGAPLEITFNADATVALIEVLIENLTYQNLSDDPRDQTTLGLALEDGDGGAIEPARIVIDITPEADRDGAVRGEVQVNTFPTGNQNDSAIAALTDGGYISVWESINQDNTGDNDGGIFAQRYNADGVPVGGEFQVNTTVSATQFEPEVAGLSDGGWVIVWRDDNGTTIKLDRYDASGNRTVTEQVVPTNTTNTQSDADVVGLSNGGYVVTWTTNDFTGGDGSSNAVKGQLFNAAGATVGGEFLVNGQTIGNQSDGAISALDSGRFVVVWTEGDVANGDGSSSAISARIFGANGLPEGGEFQVNTFTNSQQYQPAVATLDNGDFVVTWSSYSQDSTNTYGIYYQRYDSTGTPIGGEVRVNEYVAGNSYNPDIIALDTGGFVISWNEDTPVGSGQDVFTVVFDADGTRVDSDTLVNSETSGAQDNAVMAALPDGNYVVQWTSQTSGSAGDGSGDGVFQQIFGDPTEISASAPPQLQGLASVVTLGEAEANAGNALLFPAGAAHLTDADSADLDGGELRIQRFVEEPLQAQFNAPDNGMQDNLSFATGGSVSQAGNTLSVDGVAVASIVSDGQGGDDLVLDFLPGATLERVETLLGALSYTNPSDDPRDTRSYSLTITDGDGGVTAPFVFQLQVTEEAEAGALEKVGPETLVNDFTTGDQSSSANTTLDDGGWVVVWHSNGQDGSGLGIFGQRYDAGGNAFGTEFQVSGTTNGSQSDPSVAALSTGGWIVAWAGNGPGDSSGVFYSTFDSTGAPVATEVLVNTNTSSTQNDPEVVGLPGGGFAAVWVSSTGDGSSNGVFLSIFASDGAPVATEVQVNTETSGAQYQPDIALMADGRIAVTWTSQTSGTAGDGSSDGIFAAIFNADGTPSVGEFQVNTLATNAQNNPAIAAVPGGGFIIVWEDDAAQDGSGQSIVAQRFDNTATPIDGPFVVNEIITNTQSEPQVAVASDGSFVIAFRDNWNADGSSDSVHIQAYDASGARLDSQTLVNTETSGNQTQPAITALPGGNYVVSFTSVTSGTAGDGSSNGVFQQIFGDPADFNLGQGPVVQGADLNRTINEADANLGLVSLDLNQTIAVGDTGAGGFDGGVLLVAVDLTENMPEQQVGDDSQAQDVFGLISGDIGNGDVQVSGTAVSVDGTVIGTIAQDGTGGAALEVVFNASASVEDVEAVVSAVGYSTPSDAPMTDRTVRIELTDGDGLSAPTQFIALTISPESDSLLTAQDERRVNAHTQDHQIDPDIVELSGGGFVVVWRSSIQDDANGFSEGIYFQMYDAGGVPTGPERLANTTTAATQRDPEMAATPDGGFIIVWEGQNQDNGADNDFGIIAQKFDATGAAVGGEVIVNTTVTGTQFDPAIAVAADGSYVITYTSDSGDGSSDAILSQRFDATGTPVGTEQVVNTANTSSNQSQSEVAFFTDGTNTAGHVVVFTAPTSGGEGDGDSNGVFMRVYDAAGVPTGPDVLVNTTTANSQSAGQVVGLTGGGFVVVWEDSDLDGSTQGIFAQLYDATGTAQGGEFRLNTETLNSQFDFDLTATANGGFAISFTSDVADGSSFGVILATFDANGVKTDQEVLVNQETSSSQEDSALVGRANGDILVAYTSTTSSSAGDGSGDGIFLREFTAAPGADISPELSDFNRFIQARADDITGGNTIRLDEAVAFSDSTSADFDGGTLELYYTSGNVDPTDQLSIMAGGDVTLAGSTISVNGTAVGTIDATLDGANGAGLTITFNADATAADVKAILEQASYGSSGTAANVQFDDKSVGVVITDGDGGQTEPDSVYIDLVGPGAISNTGIQITDFGRWENEQGAGFDPVSEAALLAAPQRIDSDIDIDDFAGTGFDGGFVQMQNVTTFMQGLELSVDDAGTGSGQIGFDGTTVTYEGTAIGTVDASETGAGGSALRINLNAAATAEGVEALAEAMTVGLSTGAGFINPLLRLTVSNGSSAPLVQATLPIVDDGGILPDTMDEQVNTFTLNDQQSPRVAALSDGTYVVVWTSETQDVPGSFQRGIFGQVFSESGDPIGVEFQANDISSGDQFQPRVSALPNGTFVVLWTESNGRDGSGQGVYGQVFDNSGAAQGSSFQVNEEISSTQNSAQVVALDNGGFLTVWSSTTSGSAGDGSNEGIFARVHAADGTPSGGEFQVNSTTLGQQLRPRVTELPDGDVLVVWEDRNGNDGNGYGVYMQRIDGTTGNLVSIDGTTSGAGELRVNTTTAGNQEKPDVGALAASATLPNGGFVVVWEVPGVSGNDIAAQIYDIDGVPQGGEFIVNIAAGGHQEDPVVVGRADGSFSVIWADSSGLDGSGWGVFGQDFNPDGSPNGVYYQVNSETSSTQYQPDAAELNNGTLAVVFAAFTSGSSGDGSQYGVFQQLLDQPALAAGAQSPVLEGFDDTVSFTETEVNAGLQLLNQDGALSLTDADSSDFDGGQLFADALVGSGDAFDAQLGAGQGTSQDNIGLVIGNGVTVLGATVSVDGTAVGTIDSDGQNGAPLVITFNASATPELAERVASQLGYGNNSSDPDATRDIALQITDGDGGSSGTQVVTVNITPEVDRVQVPIGGEDQVNTFAPNDQQVPATAAVYDSLGNQTGYVVVWRSSEQDQVQDGTFGVYGQLFGLDGAPIGAEFRVNDETFQNEREPSVIGLPTGGFAVVFEDGSGQQDVELRIFDETGAPVTGEIGVEGGVLAYAPDIAAKSNGNILVTYTDWSSTDGSGYGIFVVEFDNTGTQISATPVQVNVETSSNQDFSSITVLSDDRYVTMWQSPTSGTAGDGSGFGVFGRIFNADGTPAGGEFIVNTLTAGSQYEVEVAALGDGGFVAVWRDDNTVDGSGTSVQMQRYDGSGAPVGGQVRVNETTVSNQYQPDVIALDNGGWLVSWYDDSGNDGSGGGVFAQVYAADGNRVDGEFQVNTEFSGNQSQPAAVALPDGGFTIVWTSATSGAAGDGSSNGIFQQVFADPALLPTSENPVLIGVPDSVTLTEADVNAGPQALTPSVSLGDADSTDLSGGQLNVAMIDNDQVQRQFADQDAEGQDQLSFLTGGAVSVSGGNVSVGGTVVGTLDSDGTDGAQLIVTFNANATPARVEQLIEALGYANTSDDPNTARLVSVQVTDGDGGFVRETIDLTITPETDGGVAVDDEVQTNSFTTGAQDESAVASLADGGYVIVWTSNNQDATGDNQDGVFLQRYDAAGAPVGGEIQVNTTTSNAQTDAHVVGLSTGGYAVAWTDFSGVNSPNSDQEVTIQVFGANGVKVGTEAILATTGIFNPNSVRLAATDSGNFFVVAAARDDASPFEYQIVGQEFTDAGGAAGSRFEVPISGNTAIQPDIAVQSDGTLAVVYTEQAVDNAPANDQGILLQRYASDGSQVGGPVVVNSDVAANQLTPRIAALDGGGYVVTWRSETGDDGPGFVWGVYAQILDSFGNAVGEQFLVNETVDGSQYEPDVAGLEGGGFAIAYRDDNSTDGSGAGVFVQQYSADGTRLDDPVQVNQEFSSTQSQPSIAALPGGNFVVSFTSETSGSAGDGNSTGVFHRILGDPADFASGGDPILDGVNAQVFYDENDVNGVPRLIDANGAVAVSDPDSTDFDGGSILVSNVIASAPLIHQINPPDDLTQDVLGLRQANGITITTGDVFVNGTQVGAIAQSGASGLPFEITLNANADAAIVELLVENLTYRNLSDDPLEVRQLRLQITDGDGGASDPVLVQVNIAPTPDGAVPVGGERVVETSAGASYLPAVEQLLGTGGDFIVVWENGSADGSGDGIFAQRFDANGNPVARDGSGLASGVTDEFQVNTTTTSNQDNPDVASFADGSFIVVWESADTSSTGVFAQKYNADGTPNGGEFQVNTLTSSVQYQPQVTTLTDGSFVVTFSAFTSVGSGDGSSYGISARVYDNTGVATGNEFVVNTETGGSQDQPDVTALASGGFVVSWTSDTNGSAGDGSGDGIFAQVFNSTGAAVGAEFQVNTTTAGNQTISKVIELTNGNLVFVWADSAADQSATGIFAQIYAPDGTAVNEEFRVNDQRISTQTEPDITALDTGGFVVTWADSNGTDGSGWGVFGQQYDAGGARIDSQFQVNTTTSGTQDFPSVSGLPGGGFVVAFNNGSATPGEVLLQVYGNALPTVSPVSASGDEDTPIVLDAAIFDAGFSDPDGNTLQAIRIETFPTGGSLELSGTPVVAGQEISRADLLAGNLVYTGAQDFNGADSFLWTGSDGIGFSADVVAANITVDPVNDAPDLEAGPDTTISEGQNLNRTMTIGDPDTDTRTFTVDYGDGSALQVFSTASTSPNLSHVYTGEGSFTVSVSVDDNAGETNSVETDSFVVTVNNADPNANNNGYSVSEDGPALTTFNILDNDTDPGNDPLTVSAVNGVMADVGQPLTLTSGALLQVEADGSFSYDPNGQFESLGRFQSATDSFTYTISDGDGGSDTGTVSFFIDGQNDAPDAVDDTFAASDLTPTSGDVLVNDTDVDAPDVLTVTEVNGTAANVGTQFALPSGALLTLNANGTFDYDPNGAVTGQPTDTFTYSISDGLAEDSATVTLNIAQSNQPPVAQDDAIAADEDTGASGSLLVDNGSGADSDPNGDPLTVSQVNGAIANVGNPLTLTGGGIVTVNTDGTFSFDTDGQYENLQVGETATETFTYTIQDGNGGSDQATVTMTINGVNDPVVAVNDTATTDEDTSTGGSVLTNDTDADLDTLSVSEVGGSSLAIGTPVTGSAGGSFVINADGTFTYDPNGQFEALDTGDSTTDSVTYQATDGPTTDTATLTVTVTGVNDAPDAEDDAFSVSELGVLNGNVLADNGNGADSDPDLNDLPVVTEVNGAAADVNSTITLASGANLTLNASGTFTYDPNGAYDTLNGGETATETFTYTIEDDDGVEDTATVTITITGEESTPVGVDDGNTTDEDSATVGNVLANDSDGDGDPLSVAAVNGETGDVGTQITLPSGALLTLNANGTYDYDPNGSFDTLAVGESTTDSFGYTVSDDNGNTDTATVTMTIAGVNDAPVAQNDIIATTESAAISDNLLTNNGFGEDSDPDTSDTLTVTAVNGAGGNVGSQFTLASGARLTVQSDGTVDYDPNGQFESLAVGESTSDSFTYTISDGNGGSDTATATIQVNGENDAPDAQDDSFNLAVDVDITNGSVLADNGNGPDSDPDTSDTLSVNAVEGSSANVGVRFQLPSGAYLTLGSNGLFDYEQAGAFSGLGAGASDTDSFTYAISDGNGGTDMATVTITIGGTNQPPTALDDSLSTDEDTAATGSNLLANDTDPNGDPLTVSQVNGSTANVGSQIALASGALLTVQAGGAVAYDPNGQFEALAVGETATDSFT
ncbi:beta strand repeat-containing protein, partial [Marinovum sp.]|uniref:beta strand repeat-containing protein n=1 Tax=Marinovum sp. TaxID=2024839 RepID=UPI003A92A5BE